MFLQISIAEVFNKDLLKNFVNKNREEVFEAFRISANNFPSKLIAEQQTGLNERLDQVQQQFKNTFVKAAKVSLT